MSRLSAGELVALAGAMPKREREIVEMVAGLRLAAGRQLERLFFTTAKPASRARAARRVLSSLTEQGVLFRLERRIGGVRAGSAGHVFGLGPVGKRLVAFWSGEGLPRVRTAEEPSLVFVRHTLAITEQYVLLSEAESRGELELLGFESEPACWRPLTGNETLKPDAFARLGVGQFEERSFLEVDCGTEGTVALRRKCQRYVRYFQAGTEQAEAGVFPRVVFITTSQRRVGVLVGVCAELPAEYWRLFAIGMSDQVVRLCSGQAGTPIALAGGSHA